MDENVNIFVIYIGIRGIRSEDVEHYIRKISQNITPSTLKGEIIFVPAHSYETKIECINPKYITEDKLIEEHMDRMNKLQIELQNQLEQLKIKNNEQA